jgi:hypothetical protein
VTLDRLDSAFDAFAALQAEVDARAAVVWGDPLKKRAEYWDAVLARVEQPQASRWDLPSFDR